MIRFTHFLIMLVTYFSFYLFNIGEVNTVYAAQEKSSEVRQNHPAKLVGKVTDVITTDSFTYVEVEAGKKKVWAAGPVTPINKGDMISFSTMMPMKNFHSKSLGRSFTVLYITNSYVTDKTTSVSSSPHEKIKQHKITKPSTTTITDTIGEVAVGSYLREATLDGLNAKTKMFSAFKGKPLVINIWASWCGPCRAEMGSLQRLAQRYNGKAFNIIGISTDDYRNKAIDLIKQTGITFENFIDHKLLLENMLGAKTIPLTLLVNADGRILKKIRGAREWDSPEMVAMITDVFDI